MKLLYFGTVCDLTEYENILRKCKTKPTPATIVFETALLEGLKNNEVEIDIYSFPMIPTFPDSKALGWGNRKQQLKCGYTSIWLRTINIPIIKQLSRQIDGKIILKNWMKTNKDNKCAFLSYSIPPFLVKEILHYGKKYNIPCYALIADLPRDMYITQKKNGLKQWLKMQYLKRTLRLQGDFDGYIYLTEAMKEVINPEKPYVVMEGIPDLSIVSEEAERISTKRKAIMYAGGLYEIYGVLNLVDAFEKIEREDVELWIFGEGTASEKIKERAQNNPKIIFFGSKSRTTVLEYEKKATVLVNPRNPLDEFTKYSFPSKTIEYMLSGTPFLTTRLPGIPKEYYPYLFLSEDNDAQSLANALEDILDMPKEVRRKKGLDAKKFVINHKNATVQAKIVLDFINDTVSRQI